MSAIIPKRNDGVKAVDDIIGNALSEIGFKEVGEPRDKSENPQEIAKNALIKRGKDVTGVIDTMVTLMECSENDNVRLKATESALAIHGIDLKKAPERVNSTVNITFNNVSVDGAKAIDAMFCPVREGA